MGVGLKASSQHKDVHSPYFLNTVLEVLAWALRRKDEIQRGKKWYLFADDRTLGVQEDPTRKLLPLRNTFSEVTEIHSKSTHKNQWLFYTPKINMLRKELGETSWTHQPPKD